LKFNIGDKIILKKESAIHLSKAGRDTDFANEIMEVIRTDNHTIYRVQINSGLYKNLYIGGLLEYRLATDNELKLDKIKKMFIKK
jgi:hypothetical protein